MGLKRLALVLAGVWVGLGLGLLGLRAAEPEFGPVEVALSGQVVQPSDTVCGLTVLAHADGPQVALTTSPGSLLVSVREGEKAEILIPVRGVNGPVRLEAQVHANSAAPAQVEVELAFDGADQSPSQSLAISSQEEPKVMSLTVDGAHAADPARVLRIRLATTGRTGEAAVLWRGFRLHQDGRKVDIPMRPRPLDYGLGPPPVLPPLRPALQEALIEWDWRMQDGIGTEREPVSYAEAIQRTFQRGDALVEDLRAAGAVPPHLATRWSELRRKYEAMASRDATGPNPALDDRAWEALWRQVHRVRRELALANPLAQVGPLLFVKQVPGAFSHQLTQVYGRYARPGGGLFVLEEPGRSMRCRQLGASAFPQGSFQHPEVSYDGRRILFAFCQTETSPAKRVAGQGGPYYHLYEMASDGSHVHQLTDGPYDDFAPKYLPDGRIVFVSTRRGGWHRCGNPGCETYTLAVCEADGSRPRPISYHETQEWDPSVLADGRIVYTRWDYVDRHAVHYQQLWTVRPDGSAPTAFYGNYTFNPVGTWEARAVPGSRRVIATAAPHHGMTAGSIILVDPSRGMDGPAPITRLTPDALFPESETLLLPHWRALRPSEPPPATPEARRWPGHCYKSPWPLSESYFLAAYSFDPLIGEPKANPPNMFGVYLVDQFGNKELLYRDMNISSLWPIPLRPRPRPPVLPAVSETAGPTGTFFVADVYQSALAIPRGSVRRLRVVQVLPKSTPGINRPRVGIPNASPGKQVLGTVPVEDDGSAFFVAPANIPLAFQVLDEEGQAIQVMRSVTYLQPGENASCVGCHEHRMTAPPPCSAAKALRRPASAIEPGPPGSKPLCYPILVQPVLDRLCVRCHGPEKPEGHVVLTGQPDGHYTASYNALAPRVAYSAWGGKPGDFRESNSEPLSQPNFFGARGSPLMKLLRAGHYGVELQPDDIQRLATWMDANALFYGTFNPDDQARQQRGEWISGPELE